MPKRDPSQLKEKVRRLTHEPGVYLMKDRLGKVLYVGKAKDLKKRVSTYFQPSRRGVLQQPKVAAMIDLIHDFEVLPVKSETEALLLEGRLIKEWRPKYNTSFVDDKRFLLVRVDVENELPRFRLTRLRTAEQSLYFGPFAHAGLLRRTLSQMRRKFGILLSDASPVELEDGRWKLYDDVRREIYGHVNEVTPDEYRARVEEACVFLDGKSREWLAEIKEAMKQAALKQQYEKAAELRDVYFALERTVKQTRKFARAPRPELDIGRGLERLHDALQLEAPPMRLECFDVSHISGTFVVASMVCFAGGKPDRSGYRRYRIKSFVGNDDYRAMEEVVGRRYTRLLEEGRPFPDLVVIDGGRGQVRAALAAFLQHGLEPPPLIGLAKRAETIIFPDEREPLQLELDDPGLQMLQRLRDEAHRFANTYNADLRSRRIRETILDDFAGLGPVRRRALLERFRTLERIREASVEELAQVEGLGAKTAERLWEFLHREAAAPVADGEEGR